MKVQGINSVNFEKRHQKIDRDTLKTNEEIIVESFDYANKKVEKSKSAKLLKMLPAVAVATVATMAGVMKKGKLSDKLFASVYTLGSFAFVSAVFDGVNGIIDKTASKISVIDKADKKHPILGSLARIGASVGATSLAIKGGKLGINKLTKITIRTYTFTKRYVYINTSHIIHHLLK